jgi:hypothetical protein
LCGTFIRGTKGIGPDKRALFTQSLCDFALAHNHASLEFEFSSAGYAGTTV